MYVNDNHTYKCSVLEATVIWAVQCLTKLVGYLAVSQPIAGHSGAHMLCPGFVTLENDRERKPRFII